MGDLYIRLEKTEEQEVVEADVSGGVKNSAKVILFNDDWHTFEEVINQLLKALKCSMDHAESLTWEVHTKGKACVYDGEIHECLRVSGVLEEIALRTQIEY